MNKKLFALLSVSALLFAGAAFSADGPAQADARPKLSSPDFWNKFNPIRTKSYPVNDPAAAMKEAQAVIDAYALDGQQKSAFAGIVAKCLFMTKDPAAFEKSVRFLDDTVMNASQQNSVLEQIIDGAFQTGDDTVIAKVEKAALDPARLNLNNVGRMACLYAGVKGDVKHADALRLVAILRDTPESKELQGQKAQGIKAAATTLYKLAPYAETAATLVKKNVAIFSAADLAGIYQGFAEAELERGNKAQFTEFFNALKKTGAELAAGAEKKKAEAAALKANTEPGKAKNDAQAAEREAQNLARSANDVNNTLARLVSKLAGVDMAAGLGLLDANRALFSEAQVYDIRVGSVLPKAKADGKKDVADSIIKDVVALPASPMKFGLLPRIAPYLPADAVEALIKDIPADQRVALLQDVRRRAGDFGLFKRGFNDLEPDAYQVWRKASDRIIDAAKDNPKALSADFYHGSAVTAFAWGDYAFAQQMVDKAYELNPGRATDQALVIYLWKKDAQKVAAICEAAKAATKDPASINFFDAVAFFAKGGKAADFDQAFGSLKLDSVTKLGMLRRVSELMFRAQSYGACQDIYGYVMDQMFVSREPKVCTVAYMPDAPKTADAFRLSPLYKDWKAMETRFEAYGNGYAQNSETDQKFLLKDVEHPQPNPAFKTGIAFLRDDDGFHAYIRCDDPEMADVLLKKRTAGSLEVTFRPAEDHVYNLFFFEDLPDWHDSVDIDLASPSPRYTATADFVKRDAVATKEGVVAHVFIPYYAFYMNLPINGNLWYFGCCRWCGGKGGGQTVSGMVHELGRMVQLKFDYTPAELAALRKNVCLKAFNKFQNNTRIQRWKTDADLGDPEFYEKCLAGYIKELTDAGEKLKTTDDPVVIAEIFDKYLEKWAAIDYDIALIRTNYIRDRFLGK